MYDLWHINSGGESSPVCSIRLLAQFKYLENVDGFLQECMKDGEYIVTDDYGRELARYKYENSKRG